MKLDFLKIANDAAVGPMCVDDSSNNFIVMEYLDGEKIGKWVKQLNGKGSSTKLKSTIRKVLEDCYNLDQMRDLTMVN